MRFLIVEDDFTCRLLLQKLLSPLGECHIAVDGLEAIRTFEASFGTSESYSAIFLDIMMPGMDGHEVLHLIRQMEDSDSNTRKPVKIIMTTALNDKQNVFSAFREQCDAYLPKPIHKVKLMECLQSLGLLPL